MADVIILFQDEVELLDRMLANLQPNEPRRLGTLCVVPASDRILALQHQVGLLGPRPMENYSPQGWQNIVERFAKDSHLLSFAERVRMAPFFVHDGKFDDRVLGPDHGVQQANALQGLFFRLSALDLKELYVNRKRREIQSAIHQRIHVSNLLHLQHFVLLQKLELTSFSSRDVDLRIMADNMPRLQTLKVTLHHSVTNANGLAPICLLPALEEFKFNGVNNTVFRMGARVNFCLRSKPGLKKIGNDAHFTKHDFSRFREDTNVALEHLNLGADSIIPATVHFGEVKCLSVEAPGDIANYACHVGALPFFPHLKQMKLNYMRPLHMWPALNRHGHLLDALKVHNAMVDSPIIVGEVLERAPHLKVLHLQGDISDAGLEQLKTEIATGRQTFEELQLSMARVRRRMRCLPKGFILAALQSPQLHSLVTHAASIPQDDVQPLIRAFEQKVIKGERLRQLIIEVNDLNNTEMVCQLLTTILKSCPNLKQLRVLEHRSNKFKGLLKTFVQRLRDVGLYPNFEYRESV